MPLMAKPPLLLLLLLGSSMVGVAEYRLSPLLDTAVFLDGTDKATGLMRSVWLNSEVVIVSWGTSSPADAQFNAFRLNRTSRALTKEQSTSTPLWLFQAGFHASVGLARISDMSFLACGRNELPNDPPQSRYAFCLVVNYLDADRGFDFPSAIIPVDQTKNATSHVDAVYLSQGSRVAFRSYNYLAPTQGAKLGYYYSLYSLSATGTATLLLSLQLNMPSFPMPPPPPPPPPPLILTRTLDGGGTLISIADSYHVLEVSAASAYPGYLWGHVLDTSTTVSANAVVGGNYTNFYGQSASCTVVYATAAEILRSHL